MFVVHRDAFQIVKFVFRKKKNDFQKAKKLIRDNMQLIIIIIFLNNDTIVTHINVIHRSEHQNVLRTILYFFK